MNWLFGKNEKKGESSGLLSNRGLKTRTFTEMQ